MSYADYDVNLDPLLKIYPAVFNFAATDGKKSEFRKQQVQYIGLCYEGISRNKNVVIEGPTGLGKTRALIASVLPMLIEDSESRVIYTTRTTAQVANVTEEIRNIFQNDTKEALYGIDATLYVGAGTVKKKICNESKL